MEANENMERVYELLEQFDFNDLSESDKKYILSVMSEKEYINMRKALKDTETFFAHTTEPNLDEAVHAVLINKSRKENRIIKFLMLPLPLYKVAASVIIILGIYSIFYFFNPKGQTKVLALNDTIYVHKTDTVYSKIIDTVRVIKEKIVYVLPEKDKAISAKLASNSINKYDCNNALCPNDIDKIKSLSANNKFSKDTFLTGFIISIN